jgi:hypothetical protein
LAHPINMTNKSVKVEIKETGCEVWTGFIWLSRVANLCTGNESWGPMKGNFLTSWETY